MARAGASLERLVASLERTLAQGKGVTVEAPKRLRDRITSSLREHDVVLTIAQGHHSLRIAIECRDRSRPITVNQVEGFWKKCQDTGIDQGIMVSSMGFYKTARMKALQIGIRCLDIEEVESFDWLVAPGMKVVRTQIAHMSWRFIPERDGVVDPTSFEILDSSGNAVNASVLEGNARQELHKLLPQLPESVGEREIIIPFQVRDGELTLSDVKSRAAVPVKSAVVKIKYRVELDLVPFKLMKYVDKDKDKNITDTAVAQLDVGTQSGEVMIVSEKDKDGKMKILYVPDTRKPFNRPL